MTYQYPAAVFETEDGWTAVFPDTAVSGFMECTGTPAHYDERNKEA